MRKFVFTFLFVVGLGPLSSLFAAPKALTVSVQSQVAPDYHREKLANGTFKAERYVVSNAGKFPGTTRDAAMKKVGYPEVAGVIARNLASQQFYLAKTAKEADLLIAIYWGTTIPFSDSRYNFSIDRLGNAARMMKADSMSSRISQKTGEISPGGGGVFGGGAASGVKDDSQTDLGITGDPRGELEFTMGLIELENRERDAANLENARILGYAGAVNDRRDMMPWADVGGVEHDLTADLEESRYYVVVRAYDFKALQRDGKQVVRWTTRISISAQGNAFDERVSQMVAAAASAFGKQNGLQRRFYGDPRVDLDDVKYLGEASVPKETSGQGKKGEAGR